MATAFSINTIRCYGTSSNSGRYDATVTYSSVTRSGGTVTINSIKMALTQYSSSYTTNRLAYRASIGSAGNYFKNNVQFNPSGTASASSYNLDLGSPTYDTNSTSVYLGVWVASTGWNTGWTNFQGNTPLGNSANLTAPARTYTVSIAHWSWGFKNGEGNNGNKTAFHLGDTSFSVTHGSSYTMNTSRATTIPNGFALSNTFGGSSVAGTWTTYSMGQSFTAGSHSWEYDYNPVSYSITYTMNGGTNSSSNPSSYNVLYGVTFANPSRTGYRFANWTISGSAVTGINPGANASFSSASDLRTKCGSRTTGNKTVVANWNANTYTVKYNGNGNTGGSTANSSHTYDVAKNLTANGFTKTGHTFAGWATSASGSVAYGNQASVKNLTSTHGATYNLYAKWNVNTYTVAYNANGGQGSMSNTSATYGTAFNLRSNAFTRSGFTFAGWSTSSTATSATYTNGQSVNNLTTSNGATVTLYAVWTLNSLPSTSLTINEILPTSISLTPTTTGKLYYVRNLPIYYANMPIKVMSDGSVWARVYYHDSKGGTILWTSASEAKNTQGTDKYSRLGELGNAAFKNSANKLELMLTYPTNSASQYNRWKQTGNPCDIYTGTGQGTFVPGYEAVHIDWSGSSWGGLERGNSDVSSINNSYIDGSVGFSNWWYAIAPSVKYDGGMPGPSEIAYRQCEIWARIPSVTGQSVSTTANTKITLSGLLDESDWYFCTEVTNSTGVAYSTTIKATTPVDQAKIRIKGNALPDTYQRVEYIQTDGAQLINLGKVGDTVATYDIAFISDNHRQLMGYGGSGTEYWGASTNTLYEAGGTTGNITVDVTQRRLVTWSYNFRDKTGGLDFDGKHVDSVPSKNVDESEYKLFNILPDASAQYGCACKLYGLQMWHYGNLIRNLIPCYRKSDNVIGLFDTVSMTFYTNIGTGVFTKGANVETGTGWLKGKTYYKKDGLWVKAKKIYIKVDGQWKVGSNYD